MIKRLKSWAYGFLALLVVIISLALFCISSTPGLYLVLKGIEYSLPGHVHIKGLTGRLKDKLSSKKLIYEDKNIKITLLNVSLDWQLSSLLHGHLLANTLQADKLIINKKQTTSAPTPPHLPFAISLKKLRLAELHYTKKGKTHRLFDLKANQLFINHKAWAISQASIQINKKMIEAIAYGQTIAPFNETLKIQWHPPKQQKGLAGTFQIDGNAALFTWKGALLKPYSIQLKGTLTHLTDIESTLKWTSLKFRQGLHFALTLDKGEGKIKGSWDKLNMVLASQIQAPIPATLALTLDYEPEFLHINTTLLSQSGTMKAQIDHRPEAPMPWHGLIETNNFNLNPMIALEHLTLHSEFWVKDAQSFKLGGYLKALYNEQALNAQLALAPKDASLEIKQGPNQLSLKGHPPFVWQLEATVPSVQFLQPKLKGLVTSLVLNASSKNAHQGQARLRVSAGEYTINNHAKTSLAFKGGEWTATLNKKGLSAEGNISIDAHKTLNSHLKLANFSLNKWMPEQQAIQGDINMLVNSLEFLQALSPLIAHPQGELAAGLHINGMLAHPIINGEMTLKNARAQLPKLGLTLEPINALLKSQDNHWDLEGKINAKEQPILIKGEGKLAPFEGNINIQGNNIPVINTAQYQFEASPQLLFSVSDKKMSLSGKIDIPSARIKPHTFSESVSLPEDAILVQYTEDTKPIPLYLDIDLQAGKDVLLDTKGLKGYLDGKVSLHYSPQSAFNATGELHIREGEYNAFSQKLIVDQGMLIFSGGTIDNPGIQLRAIRRFNNISDNFSGSNHLFDFNTNNIQDIDFSDKTTVGIAVNGRLNAPKIKLFSIPASLSQADILSLLLLGRPSAQASQAGGKLLIAAISSMNLGTGTKGVQLLQQLKESIGIDIDVQNNASFNQQNKQTTDNTAFVLSKSLSKRLILSYNLGLLGTDNNVLTLRYLLNKFFSVQVNASDTASGVDLLYTHSKD